MAWALQGMGTWEKRQRLVHWRLLLHLKTSNKTVAVLVVLGHPSLCDLRWKDLCVMVRTKDIQRLVKANTASPLEWNSLDSNIWGHQHHCELCILQLFWILSLNAACLQ